MEYGSKPPPASTGPYETKHCMVASTPATTQVRGVGPLAMTVTMGLELSSERAMQDTYMSLGVAYTAFPNGLDRISVSPKHPAVIDDGAAVA
jgi:hypothetical protein